MSLSGTMEEVRRLQAVSALARFNEWLGLEVAAAGGGEVELRLRWRDEFSQYSGLLHAGVMGGVLETACGFAASTLVGKVLASHFSMRCLRPAKADAFLVRGRVVKSGQRQIFTAAEIFDADDTHTPLASADAVLLPV